MMHSRRFLSVIGRTFAAADTDEVLIRKPQDGQLALVKVLISVPATLTEQTVTLKSGTQTIGWWKAAPGNGTAIIWSPMGVPIPGSLVARATNAGVLVTAWAVEVDAE